MTRKRNDKHSTEFGLWLREQIEIDSKLGYIATNIDYLWMNYKTGEFMFIEEKRFNRNVKFPQTKMFTLLDSICKTHLKYKGFHIIIFEKTNPEDGRIWLDDKKISKEELLIFLRFGKKYSNRDSIFEEY